MELSVAERQIVMALIEAWKQDERDSAQRIARRWHTIDLYVKEIMKVRALSSDEYRFDIDALQFVANTPTLLTVEGVGALEAADPDAL